MPTVTMGNRPPAAASSRPKRAMSDGSREPSTLAAMPNTRMSSQAAARTRRRENKRRSRTGCAERRATYRVAFAAVNVARRAGAVVVLDGKAARCRYFLSDAAVTAHVRVEQPVGGTTRWERHA